MINKRLSFKTGAMAGVFACALVVGSEQDASAQTFTTALMNSYSCSDATYGTNGTYFSGNALYPSRSGYTPNCTTNHTSNSPGSVVTATQTLRAATAQTVGLIAKRIGATRNASLNRPVQATLSPDASNGNIGLAGGDKDRGWGVWVQGAYVGVEDDNTSSEFDGSIVTILAGVDKKLMNDRLIIGISGGYEGGDFDTEFNKGNLDSDGFLVAPYVSYAFNDIFSIDATGGYGSISYDMDRRDPATNEKFTGETDATRWFVSATANAQKWYKKVRLGGKVGLSYTTEDRDSFTETGTTGTTVAVASDDTELGQGMIGVNLGYDFGKVIPYVDVTGEFDFSKSDYPTVATNQTQPEDSDFGARVALGADFRLSDRFSGQIEGNYVFLRDDYTEYGGLLKLRVDF